MRVIQFGFDGDKENIHLPYYTTRISSHAVREAIRANGSKT